MLGGWGVGVLVVWAAPGRIPLPGVVGVGVVVGCGCCLCVENCIVDASILKRSNFSKIWF